MSACHSWHVRPHNPQRQTALCDSETSIFANDMKPPLPPPLPSSTDPAYNQNQIELMAHYAWGSRVGYVRTITFLPVQPCVNTARVRAASPGGAVLYRTTGLHHVASHGLLGKGNAGRHCACRRTSPMRLGTTRRPEVASALYHKIRIMLKYHTWAFTYNMTIACGTTE